MPSAAGIPGERKGLLDNMESIGEVFFWVPVYVLLLAVLGLLWAPAAALICALVARFRKLGGESYGAAGATHSMLLILPWVYLLVRMLFGRSLPVFVVTPVYVLIYSIWLVFYVAIFNVGGVVASMIDIFVTHSLPLSIAAPFAVVSSVILPVNFYTWKRSITDLHHRHAADKERPSVSASVALDGAYLAPFIWLIVWSLVVLLITIVAGLSAYTMT